MVNFFTGRLDVQLEGRLSAGRIESDIPEVVKTYCG